MVIFCPYSIPMEKSRSASAYGQSPGHKNLLAKSPSSQKYIFGSFAPSIFLRFSRCATRGALNAKSLRIPYIGLTDDGRRAPTSYAILSVEMSLLAVPRLTMLQYTKKGRKGK